MEIINELIDEKRSHYKCFDELKRLLSSNSEFKKIIKEGYIDGEIYGFTDELWAKINTQNIRRINSFEDVFIDGANIGYCTVASKQLSYSLDNCYLCGGVLPILRGTKNCNDGSHTWIESNNEIIDTTLMLIISKRYTQKIGYIEENRYNPNLDPIYRAAKEFTLDKNINNHK